MPTILDALRNAHTDPLVPNARIKLGDTLVTVSGAGGGYYHPGGTYYGLDLDGMPDRRLDVSGSIETIDFSSATVTHQMGLQPSPSEARITVAVEPSSLDLKNQGRRAIQIDFGYSGAYERIFTGWVVRAGKNHWPYSNQMLARGTLRRATRAVAHTHQYSNLSDGGLVGALLSEAIYDSDWYDIGSEGVDFGTERPVILQEEASPLTVVGQVDSLLIYATFDTRMGIIIRRAIRFTEATGDALFTYEEGVPSGSNLAVLEGCNYENTPENRYNRVRMLGQISNDPENERPQRCRRYDVFYFEKDQTLPVTSDLIDHDATIIAACDRAMQFYNRQEEIITVRSALNPYIQPNQPMNVKLPKFQELNAVTPVVVWQVVHEMTPDGGTSTSTCRRGTGAMGDLQDLHPSASFDYSFSGPDANGLMHVTCDASASAALYTDAPLIFDWRNDQHAFTKHSDEGSDPNAHLYEVWFTAEQWARHPNVYLRVITVDQLWDTSHKPVDV